MSDEYPGLRPPTEPEMERMREAQRQFIDQLLEIPGVHGVGIGYKEVGGELTDQLALVVRVYNKLPEAAVDPHEMIPAKVTFYSRAYDEEVTIVTDVQERARPVEYPCIADDALGVRVRPIPGGYSIRQPGTGGGTLGGWVWDELNDQVVLLSNNHVLGSTAGADVIQPSSGSAPADHFADVVRTGTLDATIAAPIDTDDVELAIEGVGPAVYEVAPATVGMQVEKSGQTTEHTTGQVVLVDYISYHYGSTNDFEVHPDHGQDRFAYFGDSGSLIVERTHPSGSSWKRVVGLLWGGDPLVGNCYAHEIEDVFEDLDLTTVCAGVLEQISDDLFAESYAEAGERLVAIRSPWDRATRDPARVLAPRKLWRGMGRDLEKRLARSDRGQEALKLLHFHRVEAVHLLRDREIRRALAASTGPFVRGAWTTGEVFNREVTDEDAERFERFVKIVEERQPDLRKPLDFAKELLAEVHGRRLKDIFG